MSKRKLLLADDSVTIQKVVNLTFADEGIEVITTGDGNSAMEKLREIKPDLVMADVNMPGLNGYQICEQIKLDEATRQIPVILLVGSFEPFDEEKARAVGADDYLTKPFQSIRQLVNKVNELLATDTSTGVPADMFEKTLEMEKVPASSRPEFDEKFDDEMIETSRTENHSSFEMPDFRGRAGIDAEKSDSSSVESENFLETGDESGEQPVDESVEEETEQSENLVSDDSEKTYSEESEETGQNAAEADFSPEQTDIVPKSDDDYFAPEPVEESGHYFEESEEEPENYHEENKVETADEIPQPDSASVLELDEINLLDLPPFFAQESEEAAAETEFQPPSGQPQIEEWNEPETVQKVEENEVKMEVARRFSTLDFPPEVIEAIADKVVEKLSRKLKE